MDDNPLTNDSAESWDRLVESLRPAAMLVCIRDRMGSSISAELSPEDIWQETLLHVWRDRGAVEWRGYPSFRRWVLTVAENRIRNAVERVHAKKRGGDGTRLARDAAETLPPPVSSTTPSRIASLAEESEVMRGALADLPEDVREVVRLRLFEELPVKEVATRLALGVSAVKHRFRRGAGLYQDRLQSLLTDHSRA